MTVLRLGWRNLWRNPRRSLITAGGLSCAFAVLISLVGFGRGLAVQLLRNGTELMVGHVQLHDSRYLPDRQPHRTVGGPGGASWQELTRRVEGDPRVRQAAPRSYGSALVSTGNRSSGALVVGVDPRREGRVSRVFTPAAAAALSTPGMVVIGELLAKDLGVSIGDEVAIVAQAADGTLGNALFRVGATLRTGMPGHDRSLALVTLDDAAGLLALETDRVHELALLVSDPMSADAVARDLRASGMLPAGATARGWPELLPQLRSYVQMVEAVNRFIVALVVLFASMGVLNTMMMATFERVREFGMLNAVGMNPSSVVRTVLAESFFLVAIGLVGGLGLGWLMMQYLTTRGVNLARWTGQVAMVGTRLDPVVKAAWDPTLVAWSALALALAGVAASYWPARKATRVTPIEALRAPVMS